LTSVEKKKPGVIPVFVPHQGCPHDCVFCNQKKITGQTEAFDKNLIEQIIEAHLETMKEKRYPIEIAFYGGSFTGIDTDIQIEYLQIARRYLQDGHIHGVRLSTRPDYIDEDTLIRLAEYGVTTIELGVQSLSESVLVASNRGHTVEDVKRAVERIKSYDFTLGLQMMIGLPGDTLKRSTDTAQEIILLNPDFVRIYPTVVIKDTELEMLYKQDAYNELNVDEAVRWLSHIMPMFSKANIPIIRVGLQPTDDLTNGGSRIAGAYHPSMRQLVQSEIILSLLTREIDLVVQNSVNKISENSLEDSLKISFGVNGKDWTEFRGAKAKNFDKLKNVYQGVQFEFNLDNEVTRKTINMCIEMNHNIEIRVLKID